MKRTEILHEMVSIQRKLDQAIDDLQKINQSEVIEVSVHGFNPQNYKPHYMSQPVVKQLLMSHINELEESFNRLYKELEDFTS